MTKTPTKTSPAPSGSGRPWPARLFALGAVLLLVVSGLVVVISGLMKGPDSAEAAQRQSAYASDTLDRIALLGDLDALDRARDLGSDIGAQEVAALARDIAEAQAALERTIQQADNLPLLPSGYLPGADVTGDIPELVAGAYKVPQFVDTLKAIPFDPTTITGAASPVVERTGLHLPSTGHAAVDDALAQLMATCTTLQGLLAQAGQTVPVPDVCTVQGLGLPDPAGLTGGIGDPTGGLLAGLTGGLLPPGLIPQDPTGLLGGSDPDQQVRDANDAVDPDEEGAISAQLHAGEILGVTDKAYGTFNTTLNQLLSAYGTLAVQLQTLLDQAEATVESTAESLPQVLQERLAAIEREASQMRADAEAMAEAYLRAARSGADRALDLVADATKARIERLQDRLDGEVAKLNVQAKQVVDLAESRKAAIEELVRRAAEDLTVMADDSGIDAEAQVAAIRAAADAAVASLDGQARAAVESIKQTAVLMQADAQSAVPRLTAMGLRAASEINGTVDDAVAKATAAATYVKDYAFAWADKAHDVETLAKETAEALLMERYETYVADLKELAVAVVEGAPDVVGVTSQLVENATTLVEAEVAKDIDYILKVASDYSKVPTDARKARAEFWNTIASLDGQAVSAIDQAGLELQDLADRVMAMADLAKAEVLAIAA